MENFRNEIEFIINSKQTAERLLKSDKKIDNLYGYMLMGYPVTGIVMNRKFNIFSYRDFIYKLKDTRDVDIVRKVIHDDKGKEHSVWWLSAFSEEFVKKMDKSCFI